VILVPQISIIVPIYKAESTIGRCVDSLRSQTLSDIEIILIDDGSPDRSGEICDAFAEMDKRIRVIHKKNGGVSSARNAGLEIASGKYLMFCDSDDYVAPEWCQWMYEAMEQEHVCMSVCGVADVANQKIISTLGVLPNHVVKRNEFVQLLSHVGIHLMCNKIFRTETIRSSNLKFDTQLSRCEDLLFVIDYLLHTDCEDLFSYGSPALYHYVASGADSLSRAYVRNYLQIEQRVLSNIRFMLKQFGIPEKVYMPWYSKYAALVLTGVIANVFLDKKHGMIYKLQQLREIVSCQDYDIAIRCGGLEQLVQGRYLRILKTKQPIYIYCYHTLSILKKRLTN
jgi:glycosyltransferase involved in cell wall biosynthesis